MNDSSCFRTGRQQYCYTVQYSRDCLIILKQRPKSSLQLAMEHRQRWCIPDEWQQLFQDGRLFHDSRLFNNISVLQKCILKYWSEFNESVGYLQDLDMYHAETDTPAVARTSNLNEELGQVSVNIYIQGVP